MPRASFNVRRNGIPIADAPLRGSVRAGISYAPSFAEWEAASAAGLDLWRWDSGEYPASFRAKVLAWHAAHVLVDLHSAEAVNRAVESRMKRSRG